MFRILGELATLSAAPYLPCIYDFSTLDDVALDRASDLASELTRVWDVAIQRFAHPWYGFSKAGSLLAQKAAITDEILQAEKVALGLSAELSRISSALGIAYSGSLHDAESIDDVAHVVDQSPGIESRWLSYDAADLRSEIASWRESFHERERLEKWIQRENVQHAVGVSDFTVESWKWQRGNLERLMQDNDLQERVLRSIAELLPWLRAVQGCISRLNEAVALLQQGLDLESERSVQSAATLLRAAGAADSTATPERRWFERSTYTALRDELPRLESDLNAANAARQHVLERYDEAILQLDLDPLIHRFSNDYRSIFRFFKREYRDTIAKLRALRKDGILPRNVIPDLREVRESVRLSAEFNRNHAASISLLGGRFRGAATDFTSIAAALDTVRDLFEIIGQPSERLIRIACGLEPAAPLRSVCAMLESLISEFRHLRESTNAFNDGARFINMEQAAEHSDFSILAPHLAQITLATHTLHEYILASFGMIPADISCEWISSVAHNVEGYRSVLSRCEQIGDEVAQRFGSGYIAGGIPEWTRLDQIAQWLANRHKIAAYSNPKLLDRLRDGASNTPIASRIRDLSESFDNSISVLRASFAETRSISRQELESRSVDRILALCGRLTNEIDRLQDWHDYVAVGAKFSAAGLRELLEKLEARSTDVVPALLVPTVRKSLVQGFVDHHFSANAVLADFRGASHAEILRDFAELDRLIVAHNSTRVVRNAVERRPEQFVPYQGSESRVLLTEAGKKRRHLPIRKLFARMPRLLQQLKPCLLMSPLSVSQFLDPEGIAFDCVIFDEASQICSEDAVSAIYRGKQLVVCGDKQQLPPTAFFKESADDGDEVPDDDEDVATFESILAESDTAGFPSMQLKWHYRSAHESLIAFSNERFYNHSLITFPSATSDAESTAVELCYVPDGVYDRGGRRDNAKEADRVVELVLKHISERPSESLGVVAFSKQQADAIQNRIDLIRKQRHDLEWFFSEDRVNGFFVKNLERVQGDERDRIIFSIGYGRDKNGRLTMSFGPLNLDGGEKRLNVAVTRARSGVTVVSSIRASDMDLSETEKTGVLALHKYLDFAERGYAALDLGIVSADYDSPFEEDVAGEIRAMGYSVIPQVGVSGFRIDLGVTDPAQPGRFILGVECDGATYHSSYTARDRDRLRQEILESKMKWKLHRIWSPDWVQQRATEIERLRIALKSARRLVPAVSNVRVSGNSVTERTNGTLDTLAAPTQADVSPELAVIDAEPPERNWIRPYALASITSRPLACEFHDPSAVSRLSEMAWEVVLVEAPVHKTVVASRVAKRWGLARVGSRMVDAMESAFARLAKRGDMRIVEGCFLTPNHNFRCDVVRCAVPGSPETLRQIEYVSAAELTVAIRSLLSEAVSFEREQLIIHVARALGYDRTGNTIRERVSHILAKMLKDRILAENGDRIVLS